MEYLLSDRKNVLLKLSIHLQNIFKTKELEQEAVTQKIRVTASDGKNNILKVQS